MTLKSVIMIKVTPKVKKRNWSKYSQCTIQYRPYHPALPRLEIIQFIFETTDRHTVCVYNKPDSLN